MSATSTWAIESIDRVSGSMVVKYTVEEVETFLNIPVPPASQDTAEWVSKYSPKAQLAESTSHVQAGLAGAVIQPAEPAAAPTPPPNQQPNVVGSVNEEYLRALIYTVLEEIRESTV